MGFYLFPIFGFRFKFSGCNQVFYPNTLYLLALIMVFGYFNRFWIRLFAVGGFGFTYSTKYIFFFSTRSTDYILRAKFRFFFSIPLILIKKLFLGRTVMNTQIVYIKFGTTLTFILMSVILRIIYFAVV